MTDLVQIFENAATNKGYEFAYGAREFLNYEAGKNVTLTSGEYVVMMLPFTEDGNIVNNAVNQYVVNTQIWLGRKFDTSSSVGTKSELDETERQKYDRRLSAMRALLETYIKDVFCNQPTLELLSARVVRLLNQFATNIDFMTAEISFRSEASGVGSAASSVTSFASTLDIVSIFEDAATALSYRFAYGREDFINYELGLLDFTSGEYVVVILPFVETAILQNSMIHGWNVEGQVMIGRKFDVDATTGTKSQLDETDKQKYDRRLKAMRTTLESYLKTIFCDQQILEYRSVKMLRELNRFATNIDFITANITYSYNLQYESQYTIIINEDGKSIVDENGNLIIVL